MPLKHLVSLVLFICGISLRSATCQFFQPNVGAPAPLDPASEPVTGYGMDDDDEEDDDVMLRLANVTNVQEFVELLQHNGRQLTTYDIYEEAPGEDGKQVISGGGRLAIPDRCEPRNTTIVIDVDNTDSDTAYFPRCTRIERCGGCCPSPNLECVPAYTERISLKVLKGRVPYPGAAHLDYTGFAPVIVDRHLSCRVQCTLDEAKCGPKKRFYRRKCVCRCKTTLPCAAPTVWDSEDCSCKCPHISQCCDNGQDCGMVFNHNMCECVLNNEVRMSISADGNRNNSPNGGSQTTSTTTTTTTATPSTTSSPCRSHRCPPRFTVVPAGNSCLCRPSLRFRRPNNRRRG